MGLFDFLKRNKKEKEIRSIISNYYGGDWKYFVWNYANQIYDIPEVRTAIEKVADIFSCVPIWHKRVDKEGNVAYLEDATSRVLTYQPNPLQNGTQFIKNLITDLLLNNDAFAEKHVRYCKECGVYYCLRFAWAFLWCALRPRIRNNDEA